jgi:chloramphenicol 3-O phosphotransferase
VPPQYRTGQIVILNGVPRAGKTSIARAMHESGQGAWINLGVDDSVRATPSTDLPGIGLRPGGERPELEDRVVSLYAALFDAIAVRARGGDDVAVDVGLHESYTQPRHIRRDGADRLAGLSVLFVGVRCPLDVIWQRRAETWGQNRATADLEVVQAVQRWQDEVHAGHLYDLEVDTAASTPEECADVVLTRVREGPAGTGFWRPAKS